MRIFKEQDLVIATHNSGKASEIAALLENYVEHFYTAGELDLPEPEETGMTFSDNAILKARAAALTIGRVALADDSGLAVTALNGDPGIYSARWAGPDKDFNLAMHIVHEKLEECEGSDCSAFFVCALALAWPDGHVEVFEGRVHGNILWPPIGDKGFGYDPIFVPKGHDITFAQMAPEAKHAISHRAVAFKLLVESCFS